MTFQRYYLDVGTFELVASLGVNNAPLVIDADAEGVRTIRPINEWILPGKNQLTGHLMWPLGKPHSSGSAKVRARVFVADPQYEDPRPGTVVAQFQWPLPVIPEVYPFPVAVPFVVEHAPPTRLWEEAALVDELSADDRAAILSLVDRLRQSLDDRKYDSAFKLVEYRYQDEARANDVSFLRLRQTVQDQYRDMMTEAKIRSEPLATTTAFITSVAGGRAFRVAGRQNRDAIRFVSNDALSEIDVYVAKLNDVWTIVR